LVTNREVETYHASDSRHTTGWCSISGYNFFALSTRFRTGPECTGFAVPLAEMEII